jgi:hypothetical protein
MSEENKIAREIEKEKLLKRLAEIDKEEVEEEQKQEEESEFLFDHEIDINTKIKRKRDAEGIMFNDVIEVINLSKDDKKFLQTKQQQYAKEFLKKFTDNNFLYIRKNIYEPQ